jgi:uncharacterized membrane protein
MLNFLNKFLIGLHNFAIALWVGGIAFFSFGVAPVIFQNVESRTKAGNIIGEILNRFNLVEFLLIIILISTMLYFIFQLSHKNKTNIFRLFVIVFMSALTFVYGVLITTKMKNLREDIKSRGGYEVVNPTDPVRVEFNTLHKVYSNLVSINFILGVILIFVPLKLSKEKEEVYKESKREEQKGTEHLDPEFLRKAKLC